MAAPAAKNEPVSPEIVARLRGFSGPDAPRQEDLYKCVHCGFCLSACPTYLETGLEAESPRGRIALMKAVNEGRLEINDSVVGHWDLCLQCRACEVACPSGVPYGRLMEATRSEVERNYKRPLKSRIARSVGYNRVLKSPALLRTIGRATKLYNASGMRTLARGTGFLKLLPGGIESLDKNMPDLRGGIFKADGRVVPAQGVQRARVAMLAGCVMTLMHAPALEAAVRVLSRNGVEVHLTRDQGCCGALNAHAGELESAREMARRNIDSFLSSEPDAIVVASAGCGSTMKEYDDLFRSDPEYMEKAGRVSSLTRDIHEFLAELPLIPPKGRVDYTVTYQDACHLASAQRITAAPRKLLDAIQGLKRVEMAESSLCCGSAGTYSISEQEMSSRLGRRKATNVVNTGAQVVATGNPGCALQMTNYLRDAGSPAKVRYVVQLLDEAYAAGETAS
jgi:glycolate oxidase iron-sulfur subunit